MAERLSLATVSRLPADVILPEYRAEDHGVGHVHLGLGAFHRAHQALYTDRALGSSGGHWRILGVSLRSPAVRDQLAPQDGRHLVAVRDAGGERLRLSAAIAGVLVASEDGAAVVKALADPAVRIVTLTVTEKGYGHDPATGALDRDRADIAADIASPGAPATAPGFLVEALARRRAAGVPAPAVLSCDNLAGNGAVLRGVLAALARAGQRPALADHIQTEVAFPSTMVDRIVPATTARDIAEVEARIGLVDEGLVVTEPFSQWVIEDFPGPRPDWAAAGAHVVRDVAPFELMKLRLLNGSHSAIAYLSQLAGWTRVDEAVADPRLAAFVVRLMAMVDEGLPPVPGLDLLGYRAELMQRFANPALAHSTRQIAMDGSQKLPQRLVAPAREAVRQGRDPGPLALAIGAWLAFLVQSAGQRRPVDDPFAGRLLELAGGPDPLAELVRFRPVFGEDEVDPRLSGPVVDAARRLLERGVAAVLASEAGAEGA